MAEIDYIRGHYEEKTDGLPGPWEGRYAELLEDRYGIHLTAVAGYN